MGLIPPWMDIQGSIVTLLTSFYHSATISLGNFCKIQFLWGFFIGLGKLDISGFLYISNLEVFYFLFKNVLRILNINYKRTKIHLKVHGSTRSRDP